MDNGLGQYTQSCLEKASTYTPSKCLVTIRVIGGSLREYPQFESTAGTSWVQVGGRGPFCEGQAEIHDVLRKLLVMQLQITDCLVASLDGLT